MRSRSHMNSSNKKQKNILTISGSKQTLHTPDPNHSQTTNNHRHHRHVHPQVNSSSSASSSLSSSSSTPSYVKPIILGEPKRKRETLQWVATKPHNPTFYNHAKVTIILITLLIIHLNPQYVHIYVYV